MFDGILYGGHSDSQANYDALRYTIISNAIMGIHLFFCLIFLLASVYPLAIYNVFAVIFYFVMIRKLADLNRYLVIFFLYVVEIVTHAVLATILVGWDFLFMYYLIGLIPVSFYMTFSITAFKRKLEYPYLVSGIVAFFILAMRVLTFFVKPVYTDVPWAYKIILCIANILVALVCTFLFSFLFAVDVNSMQFKMEAEQEKLEDKASYDPLTHFLNRRIMDERLNNAHRNAIINGAPYSLIMCDIDFFKKFNDTYGHDCGDYVLQTLSKIIGSQTRSKDSVCRWGGEEFLLLIADSQTVANEIAERIRKSIESYEFYYEGQNLHVTITLGVSSYYPSSKYKTLIEIADKRLYKGKESGRNKVVIS